VNHCEEKSFSGIKLEGDLIFNNSELNNTLKIPLLMFGPNSITNDRPNSVQQPSSTPLSPIYLILDNPDEKKTFTIQKIRNSVCLSSLNLLTFFSLADTNKP